MPRYTKASAGQPLASFDYPEPLLPSLSASDHLPIDTGLLWADGSKIMREPRPIGFGRDNEW